MQVRRCTQDGWQYVAQRKYLQKVSDCCCCYYFSSGAASTYQGRLAAEDSSLCTEGGNFISGHSAVPPPELPTTEPHKVFLGRNHNNDAGALCVVPCALFIWFLLISHNHSCVWFSHHLYVRDAETMTENIPWSKNAQLQVIQAGMELCLVSPVQLPGLGWGLRRDIWVLLGWNVPRALVLAC